MKNLLKNSLYFIFLFALLSLIGFIFVQPILQTQPTQQCDLFFSNQSTLYGVPLAETMQQQEKGLSGKNSAKEGMLFLIHPAEIVHFWMRDTKIPLSIGFFSEKGVLFQIENMLPYTETLHTSHEKAGKVLELPQGEFDAKNIRVGTLLMKVDCQPISLFQRIASFFS